MTGSPFTAYVRGGELRGYRFGPDDDGAPTILAIHGVTASSRAFLEVAAQLSGYRILAPDLRGRARSRELPPPYGLRQHAEDLASLMQTYDMRSPVVVGHSMGAFVAVALADIADVSGLVLVDGGFPLVLPEGMALPELLQAALGPALDRLDREFASVGDYLAFWRDGRFGIGVGTIVLILNAVLLGTYTFGCHSLRHLVGGQLNCFTCDSAAKTRYGVWQQVSWLNARHMLFAWLSLIFVGFADFYVRMVSMGYIRDLSTWG